MGGLEVSMANLQLNEIPLPTPPGTAAMKTVNVATNCLGVRVLQNERKLFRYDVEIISPRDGRPDVVYTKKTGNDYIAKHRKNNCVQICQAVTKKHNDVFKSLLFYDAQSIMYTTEKLVLAKKDKDNRCFMNFEIDGSEIKIANVTNGNGANGQGAHGHRANGHGINGHEINGHGVNGNGVNGNGVNGNGVNGNGVRVNGAGGFGGVGGAGGGINEAVVVGSLEKVGTIFFIVKEVTENFEVALGDCRQVDGGRDRSALQYIDIVTSCQAIFDYKHFIVFDNGKVFPIEQLKHFGEQECPKLGGGKRLYLGATKAVRLVEGPRGRGHCSAALFLDSLKCAFHESGGTLLEKLASIFNCVPAQMNVRWTEGQLNESKAALKGLMVGCTYGAQRRIQIDTIEHPGPDKMKFKTTIESTEQEMNVFDYYQKKYGVTIQYPELPFIGSREKGRMNLYPIELLVVLPNQRVTIPQQTSEQSKITTKECAVLPSRRIDAIKKQTELLGFCQNQNEFLKKSGFEVVGHKPLQMTARLLNTPLIKYGGALRPSKPATDQPTWKTPGPAVYMRPVKCAMWALYAIPGGRGDTISKPEAIEFAKRFIQDARKRGMEFSEPADCQVIPSDNLEKRIPSIMQDAASHNCKFVVFIVGETHKTQDMIKYQEKITGVVTQVVKVRTATSVIRQNKFVTMENIIHKTNLKLGGNNFTLDLTDMCGKFNMFRPGRMIMGVGLVNAPPGSDRETTPAVIGYSMNRFDRPTEFVGDFLLQDSRADQMVKFMPMIVQRAIMHFRGGSMGGDMEEMRKQTEQRMKFSPPKEIVIIRSGISEGNYPLIRNEVALIRSAIAGLGAEKAEITYITVHKEHNTRIFNAEIPVNERAPKQNIGAGTVIDTHITSPRYKEFFLNSHITLMGTARTPRYTVLVDNAELSMDELQALCYSLCYDYQIVNSPVSVPAPLYIANMYAKRGAAIYKEYTLNPHTPPNVPMDIDSLNQKLPFFNNILCGMRTNA